MKKLSSLILSFLLLFVDFQLAEHHHEDHQLHIDCQLCLVQSQPQHSEKTEISLLINTLTFLNPLEKKQEKIPIKALPHTHFIRAPPTG